MKSILKKTFLLVSFIMIASCDVGIDDNQNVCSYIAGVGTTQVTGPVTAAVNEEITLTTTFSVANNCGSFYLFNETNGSNNDKNITINARFDGCNCNDIPVVKTEPYKFKAISPGVYNLKFKKTNTEFITHTITVS